MYCISVVREYMWYDMYAHMLGCIRTIWYECPLYYVPCVCDVSMYVCTCVCDVCMYVRMHVSMNVCNVRLCVKDRGRVCYVCSV